MQNSTPDLEVQRASRCVLVMDRRQNPELTAAFRNPDILSRAESFVPKNDRFRVNPLSTVSQEGRHVIFIKQELNWVGICTLILTGIIFSIGMGIIVGLLTNRVDLGVGVTSDIAAIITLVEAFIFWLYKY